MNPKNFFAELKRRNVYKVAVAYAVVAWLLIQAASILLPTFEAPDWVMKVFVAVIAAGFPIALVIAWAFELTPEGVRRTQDVDLAPGQKSAHRTWIFIVIIASAMSLGLFFLGRYTAPKSGALRESSKSIAVLPFENLSDEKDNAFFANGVHDEILTNLAKVADLKVISRTSVMSFRDTKRNLREIAHALGVAHIVEGSVQRAAGRVRVSAQLIDARTDTHLWAERYDRELADVFLIQSEIAQKIVNQLQAALSPREQEAIHARPTADIPAYDLYLRAKEIDRGAEGERMKETVTLLNQAIERDPNFVPALCLLARAHLRLYWYNQDHTPARLELAEKALGVAARLQPDSGEVYLTRAILYYWGRRDYESALAELARARRALPNDADVVQFTGLIERRQGRWEESTRHLEEAMATDPRNAQLLIDLTRVNYFALKRYDDAARILESGLVWNPNDFDFELRRAQVDVAARADLRRMQRVVSGERTKTADPHRLAEAGIGLALAQRDYRAAERALAAHDLPDVIAAKFVTPRQWYEGVIARGLGDTRKAETAFLAARARAAATFARQPDDATALIILAEIDAALGRKAEAISEGEEATKLLPVEKDAIDGPRILLRLAGVYSAIGESNRALDLLEQAAKGPSDSLNYGTLKLDEVWNPLRREPRFEKLVASLTPTQP